MAVLWSLFKSPFVGAIEFDQAELALGRVAPFGFSARASVPSFLRRDASYLGTGTLAGAPQPN